MNRMLKYVLLPGGKSGVVLGWFLLLGVYPLLAQSQEHEGGINPLAAPSFAGVTYQMPDARIEGNPWLFPMYTSGSLSWMGRLHQSDNLRYDLVLNQLVLLTSSGRQEYLLALSPLHVPDFSLGDRQFRSPSTFEESEIPEELQSGYHELVFAGDSVELICLHKKRLLSESRSMSIQYYFDYKRSLYLLQDGQFIRILTNRQLLKSLGSHKKELKRLMRDRALSVKKSEPAELASVLEMFEQLSHQS